MAVQFLAMLPFAWITLACYTTASLHVPQRDLGIAIGLIGTFRSLGGSIGSVIFSSIFTQTASKQVAKRITETAIAAKVPTAFIPALIGATKLTILGIPGEAAKLPNVPASVLSSCVTAARYGYAYSFRVTWLASIPFGVIALFSAIVVRDPSKYFTNHVEVHLGKRGGVAGAKHNEKEFEESQMVAEKEEMGL